MLTLIKIISYDFKLMLLLVKIFHMANQYENAMWNFTNILLYSRLFYQINFVFIHD